MYYHNKSQQLMKRLLLTVLAIIGFYSVWAQSITNVAPSSANTGDLNVSVTMTLDNMAPPDFVSPTAAAIGSVSGTSISRNGYDVTATFSFSGVTPGYYDVSVTFPGPTGDLIFSMSSGFMVIGTGPSVIVYVDGINGNDSFDGLSWAQAKKTIQAGINTASSEGFGDVWVKSGTYFPTDNTDRTASIQMNAGIDIYGGFAGSETDISERNPVTNVTIISGDIGNQQDSTDNSYHLLIGANSATIDGFVLTGGTANGELEYRLGGAIFMEAASPTISNCIFENNYAEDGGALYIFNDSKPNVTNCTFRNNKALLGGAVVCRVGGAATIDLCTFENNFAEWRGGGLFIDYGAYSTSPVIVTNCNFTANSTNGNGGGFYCDDLASQYQGTYITITGCSFTNNSATYRGGGMSNFNQNIFITITSCDFTGNTSGAGGNAIANDYQVSGTISGCTFNSGQDVDSDSSCNITIN